jgi:hypothetical protein
MHILSEIEMAAGFFNQSLEDFLKADRKTLRHSPDRYVEECNGIAEGAGISDTGAAGVRQTVAEEPVTEIVGR